MISNELMLYKTNGVVVENQRRSKSKNVAIKDDSLNNLPTFFNDFENHNEQSPKLKDLLLSQKDENDTVEESLPSFSYQNNCSNEKNRLRCIIGSEKKPFNDNYESCLEFSDRKEIEINDLNRHPKMINSAQSK